MNNIVTLTVNSEDYQGWKSVRIEAGLERVSRSFELSVTQSWPGNADHLRRIGAGDLVEVRIGDDLVVTGHVDATPIDYDANGYTIMIRGRSRTADLVDCSAEPTTGQFKGLKADQIAAKLAEPFGMAVIAEADVGAAITDFQIQQGESGFEALDRIIKQRQLLMTDTAAGDLLIASVGSGGKAYSGLELGVNILKGSAGFDFTEVYTKYSVKGQKSGSDDSFGDQASKVSGLATDNSLKRERVLIIRQSGQADAATCQQRADYEAKIRLAKAGELRYTVAGWRQADGSLWRPNLMVDINDDFMSVNKSLLISEVRYSLDDSGELTELVVIAPEAFATQPDEKAKATKRKGGSKKGSDVSWPE